MEEQKGKRNYKSLWLLSVAILVIGIILTINLALIRPLGYALLAIGAVGIIWSIVHMDKGGDQNKQPPRFR